MLETAERFTPVEKEPALRQLLLLIGGLRALAESEHDSRLVLDAFLLRSLAVAGYAPALEECARCGASARERRLPAFAIAAGGMVCASCRPPGAASPAAGTPAPVMRSSGDVTAFLSLPAAPRAPAGGSPIEF